MAANNNSATSVLRLQKAISVVNMRAEQRLQKQSRDVINSPSRIWEGMNIVWNKRGEKKIWEEGMRRVRREMSNLFMQILEILNTKYTPAPPERHSRLNGFTGEVGSCSRLRS